MDQLITIAAGIDTGKHWLDVALYPRGDSIRLANTAGGHRRLVGWLRKRHVARIGIEASGGYEQAALAGLRAAGLPVMLLQPRQVRAYATCTLQRAKTDRLDAALIADFTARFDRVRPAPDPRLAPLAEHLRLIEQIEQDLARARTRLEAYRQPRLRRALEREIDRLDRRHKAELALLLKATQKHADLAHRLQLIESVDGIGRRTALALLLLMPELGRLAREQIAALAGLAPYDDTSGERNGARAIDGGRARVRRALYAAALPAAFRWNAALVAFYKRLTARHKPHKQALTACARKLLIYVNAVIARDAPWTPEPQTQT